MRYFKTLDARPDSWRAILSAARRGGVARPACVHALRAASGRSAGLRHETSGGRDASRPSEARLSAQLLVGWNARLKTQFATRRPCWIPSVLSNDQWMPR